MRKCLRAPLFILAAGLLWLSAGAKEKTLEPVVLQLPFTHQFQFAGVYAAIEQGYFRAEGLEVEVRQTVDQAHAPIEEVMAGHVDFGIAQGPQLIAARLAGRDLVVLAAIMQHSPQVLLTRHGQNLNTPHDLIGRRVALDSTSLQSEIRQMLEREGVGMDRVILVPNDWDRNELIDRTADAMSGFVLDLPYWMNRSGTPVHIIRPADYGVDFYGDCLFTSARTLQASPERAARMRRALLRGWVHALQAPEQVIDLIMVGYPAGARLQARPDVDREALRYEAGQMAILISADLIEPGRINVGRWRHMAEVINGYDSLGDISRIEPMLYQPPTGWTEQLQHFAPWLVGGLLAALAIALGSVLANRRLQHLVARRTAELQRSEQQQREYFEQAPAPIVIEDYSLLAGVLAGYRAEGVTDLRTHLGGKYGRLRELVGRKRVVAANRMALASSGVPTIQDLNRIMTEIMTDQALDMFLEELVALWEGTDRLTLEKIYRQPSKGGLVHMLVNWQVGRTDGKLDLGHVRLVFTDVTLQKETESALRQSESRYRELFEYAAGGIYRSSPTGQFQTVNPSLARMLGFERPEDMIQWARDNRIQNLYVQPERRAEFQAACAVTGQVQDFESEVIARDGRTLWITENAHEVRDAAGRLQYYEGFIADITARRQLEEEQGRASKLEAVGILAGGIAHDFNNVLTVVLGNVTLAEAGLGENDPNAERLAAARRAILRARDLTLQLLTFAKGGEPLKAAVDLAELLRESVAFALHGSKVRAEYQIAPDLWPVHADKGQLGQVVQNLAINAVQAMPAGGRVTLVAGNLVLTEANLGVLPLMPGRYVRLVFTDTGSGIARENLAKIFDPYFTTKAQGSGLGLATAYSIIRKHGGHILADSEPGGGAVFRLWVPASAAPVVEAEGPEAPNSLSPFQARVLFMDDEESIRSMAAIFMERLGLGCDLVTDGAAVVRKYREALASGQRYDAVIMDLTVPGGMGGREAMAQLREIDPAVRAIVSSGYSQDPVMANHQQYGFSAVLPKPYGLVQLRRTLKELIRERSDPA